MPWDYAKANAALKGTNPYWRRNAWGNTLQRRWQTIREPNIRTLLSTNLCSDPSAVMPRH